MVVDGRKVCTISNSEDTGCNLIGETLINTSASCRNRFLNSKAGRLQAERAG